MRVFLSYRRADNDYLAAGVHDRLLACSPSVDVFYDLESIDPGADFREMIVDRILDADVVVVLIGTEWQPDRLHRKDDFVRLELVTARSAEKRVVPVLHSGAQVPRVTDLPDLLAWLPHSNAFEFGGARQLDNDVRRLYERLTNRVPELGELRARTWALYDRHLDRELLDVVEEAWREHAVSPSPALADCCRAAAVTLTRVGDHNGKDLWHARSLSTAFQSGSYNALAAALLPFFFRLVTEGDVAGGREVLHEIGRLMKLDDPLELPPGGIMKRVFQEKLAYSYLVEGSYERALQEYELALPLAIDSNDYRGQLKIRGSIALCLFRLGNRQEARDITDEIASAASDAGFLDVARPARHNLDVMRVAIGTFLPYEVT